MCAVSMIVHGIQNDYPNFPSGWTQQPLMDLWEVIKRLDAIDKALKAKDCDESTKQAFLKQLDNRIAALEKRSKRKKLVRK